MRKPSSRFDWVCEAYAKAAGGDKDNLTVFDRILAADGIDWVWRALEKRFSYFDRSGLPLGDVDPIEIEVVARFDPGSRAIHALRLVALCQASTRDFMGLERLGSSERKDWAEKFIEASAELRKLVRRFQTQAASSIALDDELARSASLVMSIHRPRGAEKRWKEGDEREAYATGLNTGAISAAKGVASLLHGLEADVDRWAHAKPLVRRPNSKNAERTYFIRRLSAYFLRRYGSPLRKQTFILAGVFFDVADLNEATIAKLAPSAGLT